MSILQLTKQMQTQSGIKYLAAAKELNRILKYWPDGVINQHINTIDDPALFRYLLAAGAREPAILAIVARTEELERRAAGFAL